MSKESRYEAEYKEHRAADAILRLVTGGFSQLLPKSADTDCKLTDTKTGESHTGKGTSRHTAENDAHSKFGKK